MNVRAVFVILWWCAASAFALPAAAQAPDAAQTTPPDPLEILHFRPPDKWHRIPARRTVGTMRVLGIWSPPAAADADANAFSPNIVLGYVRYAGTLEDFVAEQERVLKSPDSRSTIVTPPVRKQFCLSNPAYVVRLQLATPNLTVLEEQVYVVSGGAAYIATYSYVEPPARPADLLDAETALQSLCGGKPGVPA